MVETTVQEQPQTPVAEPIKKLKLKKKWITLVAPHEFNDAVLGETYVAEADRVLGKTISVNLMTLTHDAKKQNMSVTFNVVDVKNNQGTTVLTGFEIPPGHIKRLTKRSKAKVEDSFEYTTIDKVKMQIKFVAMTRTETHKSKLTLVRLEGRKFLTEAVKPISFNEVMMGVVSGNLQRDLKSALKKYHALSAVFIRVAKKMPHQ
ncbi:MAG: hypothetical protein WC595_02390 [Candidatus Nanoarchaeia archaeon]